MGKSNSVDKWNLFYQVQFICWVKEHSICTTNPLNILQMLTRFIEGLDVTSMSASLAALLGFS